jgi:polyisoprenoid-binding protein YceI
MNERRLAAGVVGALMALVAVGSSAVAQQVSSKDPKAVKAGTYKVEPYHSQVSFEVSHFGFTDFSGFFSGASGTLQLDPAKVSASKLEVTIPVQSVLTTVPVLDTELKGDKWFDAVQFPNATFVSTKVTSTGKDTATIAGDLTIHGVTKPVMLKARLVGSGTNPLDKSFTVGLEATGTIKRSDFGIKQYLPLVGDEIALKIAGAFVLQP